MWDAVASEFDTSLAAMDTDPSEDRILVGPFADVDAAFANWR
jgi:hypothetical protein